MLQLRHHKEEFDDLGVEVAVVTFEAKWIAEAYVRETELPWPVLLDPSRSLYRAYGMERKSWWAVLGPASWGTYVRLLLRGRRLHLPTDDVYQIGGDVLIDRHGLVRLHHVSRNPSDRPSVESLLAVCRGSAVST